MSYHDALVKNCANFGHLYFSTIVQRCPHTEGLWLLVSVWRDEDDDQPTELYNWTMETGPFDPIEDVLRMLNLATEIALTTLVTASITAG